MGGGCLRCLSLLGAVVAAFQPLSTEEYVNEFVSAVGGQRLSDPTPETQAIESWAVDPEVTPMDHLPPVSWIRPRGKKQTFGDQRDSAQTSASTPRQSQRTSTPRQKSKAKGTTAQSNSKRVRSVREPAARCPRIGNPLAFRVDVFPLLKERRLKRGAIVGAKSGRFASFGLRVWDPTDLVVVGDIVAETRFEDVSQVRFFSSQDRAFNSVADGSLDFLYLSIFTQDTEALRRWWRKLKPCGWLAGALQSTTAQGKKTFVASLEQFQADFQRQAVPFYGEEDFSFIM
mmetsp:Transcript_12184/g.28610  ORF Transcript_12184/g.28610 Transcript_12184/m.28610 type:complete len:287 (+) Transcript_12184:3-863(+)